MFTTSEVVEIPKVMIMSAVIYNTEEQKLFSVLQPHELKC